MELAWAVSERGGMTIARPEGRIDEASWTDFAQRLGESVAGGRTVILDLSGVSYMSSRGLRALAIARKEATAHDGEIILAAPNDLMREILEISRYDKIFRVVDAVDAAL